MPKVTGISTKVTEHFSVEEFRRHARPGTPFDTDVQYPPSWVDVRLRRLCETLEVIRAVVGHPLHIGSGYRDPAYNTYIGGARSSQHMQGRAADITTKLPAPELHDLVLRLYNEKRLPYLRGLGRYPTFVHVDIRPTGVLVRWSGSRKEN
jgi:uncharacterized protein YcbK (DUF882 family)